MTKKAKLIPYLLILLIVAGFFIFAPSVQAAPPGQCWNKDGKPLSTSTWSYEQCIARTATSGTTWGISPPSTPVSSTEKCWDKNGAPLPYHTSQPTCEGAGYTWGISPATLPIASNPISTGTGLDAITAEVCSWYNPTGCLLRILYVLLNVVASFLLAISAMFFNAMIAISISSKLISSSTFISEGWVVVRDLSNIFFILILLYIAFQTILGLGGHGGGPKKMIAQVIIMALLINFSMFFTKVIIDSSNILALVFYNRIQTETTEMVSGKKQERPYDSVAKSEMTGLVERDLSGGIVNAFDITKTLDGEFFSKAQTTVVDGKVIEDDVPFGTILSLIIISGAIMLYAAYTFLIAGLSFLGRLIELWVLIIFSPFAFMSSVVPKLSHIEGIGWEQWLKKLLSVSFMAPIFMFFMYLIFKLVNTPIFDFIDKEKDGSTLIRMLSIVIPALILMALLKKATEFARKGGGQFGEAVISGAKMVGGLAIGGAALGGALAGRATIGSFMKGASTGDTAANRMQGSDARILAHQATLSRANTTIVERMHARKEIFRERKDQIKGGIQQRSGIQDMQAWVGRRLNQDQHNVEHAAHARHELDEVAGQVTEGKVKEWDKLNGEKRYEARRKMERDRVVRDNAGAGAAPGSHNYIAGLGGLGTRKWDALTGAERDLIDTLVGAQVGGPNAGQAVAGGRLADNLTHADQHTIQEARTKQGTISSVIQSSVTGTYDPRKLADVIMKEQSTGFAKIAMGLTGALAMGMRGGFKQMGVSYGTAQGNFFKDLGNTISESLKNAKINVDLSKVGEEKKESGGGGHH